MSTSFPRLATRHELALLRFPDPATRWVVVLVAHVSPALTLELVTERVRALHVAVPLTGARLRGEVWQPGDAPAVTLTGGDVLADDRIDAAFDLADDAPLRILLSQDGLQLGIAGHHAALDGLALAAVVSVLAGGPLPGSVASPPPGLPGAHGDLVRRLLAPADRVAPSPRPNARDAYVSAEIGVSGPGVTGRIAAACAAAAAAHNARWGHPFTRMGISVAKGGPAGVGNVASYRRLDLAAGADVARAVAAALGSASEPREQVRAGIALRLARPFVRRLSDSFLVSNLGRHAVEGCRRVDFYPVARGRSAVAFGAASVKDGLSTLTLRARDLQAADARLLLDEAVELFTESPATS